MKKAITILLIAMMSMNLMACDTKKEEPTTAAPTEAVTEAAPETEEETTEEATEEETEAATETEAVENTSEAKEAFLALMDTIYGVRAGTAGSSLRSEEAGAALIDFALNYGADVKASSFSQLAAEWFESSGADREDFSMCMDSTYAYAIDQNADMETDAAFLNVINGIYAVCDENPAEGADGGDEDDAAEAIAAQKSADFTELMDAVYGVRPASAGCSLRAEEAATKLVNFVFTYGIGSSSSTFETMADEWFTTNSDTDMDLFRESWANVDGVAQDSDDSLAEDAAYLCVKGGIEAAINK